MSRTRNKYNNAIYYLFKQGLITTTTTNEIENDWAEFGQSFQCKVENKVKGYRDAMTGVWQSTTIKTIKTIADLDFEFGDRVSQVPNPSDGDAEMIQKAHHIEQYDRGGKHNNTPIMEWVLEVA